MSALARAEVIRRARPMRTLQAARRAGRGVQAALLGLAMVTAVALLAPVLAPHDPLQPVGEALLPPGSHGFLMGTDEVGLDIFSRVLYGLRSSWLASCAIIASGVLAGGLVGLLAGARGGILDGLLMRLTDAFLALPPPLVAIAIVAALGPSLAHTIVGVAVVWWPPYARIVRGQIRALAALPHYEAAKLAGIPPLRRVVRHLLPGTLPNVVVAASLDVGNVLLTLAGISFLGLGAPAPAPELGGMSARGLQYVLQQWWVPVMPGLALLVVALVANFAGDAISDLLGER
jgi:peptide/nickel transport system permease protein